MGIITGWGSTEKDLNKIMQEGCTYPNYLQALAVTIVPGNLCESMTNTYLEDYIICFYRPIGSGTCVVCLFNFHTR